jgi:hypothetical protein
MWIQSLSGQWAVLLTSFVAGVGLSLGAWLVRRVLK